MGCILIKIQKKKMCNTYDAIQRKFACHQKTLQTELNETVSETSLWTQP